MTPTSAGTVVAEDRDESAAKELAGVWEPRRRNWLLGLFLIAATVVAYLPVWHAGFVWDDDELLLQNPGIQTPAGLTRLWTCDFPLATTTLWLEWQLWGATPLGYHLVNVLLHALSAVLLWRVLARLNIPGAALAAAIFAVHPVNVESVAWISERKNTLCMFFYLLSLLLYLHAESAAGAKMENGGWKTGWPSQPTSMLYWLSVGAFALALLSKTAVALLPLVLLGLAWWQRGRLALRDVRRTIPFVALAAPAALASLWFQSHQAGATMLDVRSESFWSRLAGAGWAIWFYLYKAVWPLHLSFVYPRWRMDTTQVLAYFPTLLVAAAFLVCWRYRHGWGKALLLGLGYFVVMLVPVLGFANIYFMRYALVADHWQYFAIIGPIALVAIGLTRGLRHLGKGNPFLAPFLCTALLLVLGVLTWRQSRDYTDIETLWVRTLARNPDCFMAHNNLGNVLAQQDKHEEAVRHFKEAVRLKPDHAGAQSNLALSCKKLGRVGEAIAHYREAIRLQPDSLPALNNLAWLLATKPEPQFRDGAEAVALATRACELTHYRNPVPLGTLAAACAEAGRFPEAVAYAEQALQLTGAGQSALAARLATMRETFRANRSYHAD